MTVLCCLGGAIAVQAASGDADGTYTVTMTKIEISKDSGTTYTTMFEGSQAVNIASVNAGAVAAGLASGVILDSGVYNIVRATIGSTMQFKGYVNNGGTTIYTSGGTDAGAFSTNAGAANTPGGDYATSTFTIPPGNRTNTTAGLSIQVQPGSSPTVTVQFDTTGVLTQAGGIPSIGAPTVTITSQ